MFFLVVDDDLVVRMMVSGLLEKSGLATKVLVCPDAAGALEDLRRQPIDFVISDWNMPGMSGLELLQRIRTGEDMKKVRFIPVLLLTGAANRNNILDAAKAGVTDYVIKPFKPDTLMEKIRRIVGNKAGVGK